MPCRSIEILILIQVKLAIHSLSIRVRTRFNTIYILHRQFICFCDISCKASNADFHCTSEHNDRSNVVNEDPSPSGDNVPKIMEQNPTLIRFPNSYVICLVVLIMVAASISDVPTSPYFLKSVNVLGAS